MYVCMHACMHVCTSSHLCLCDDAGEVDVDDGGGWDSGSTHKLFHVKIKYVSY